jgi:hypothetical protein
MPPGPVSCGSRRTAVSRFEAVAMAATPSGAGRRDGGRHAAARGRGEGRYTPPAIVGIGAVPGRDESFLGE